MAPLDLEIKAGASAASQSSKKSPRMHTVLSSSALSELDKSLPILEEDVAHREEGALKIFWLRDSDVFRIF